MFCWQTGGPVSLLGHSVLLCYLCHYSHSQASLQRSPAFPSESCNIDNISRDKIELTDQTDTEF